MDMLITNDHTEEIKKLIEQRLENANNAVGMQCISYAKQNLNGTPHRIDTGLLVNSLTWAVGGQSANISTYTANKGKDKKAPKTGSYSGQAPADSSGEKSVYIGTNVEYAIYVHEGTQKMTANHFLKDAVMKNKDTLKKIYEQALKG